MTALEEDSDLDPEMIDIEEPDYIKANKWSMVNQYQKNSKWYRWTDTHPEVSFGSEPLFNDILFNNKSFTSIK